MTSFLKKQYSIKTLDECESPIVKVLTRPKLLCLNVNKLATLVKLISCVEQIEPLKETQPVTGPELKMTNE